LTDLILSLVEELAKLSPQVTALETRLGKAVIDTGLVVLMVIYAPALLLMYVMIWLTSPFRNKIMQVSAAFASILAITHLAGVVFEAVAVLSVFAVDLLTGQVVARMDRRERNKLAKAA
jgi:glycerol-3-phosphate acyltransferase PlsY